MTADVGAQLRKGVVEYCILGLLAHERMYGWQLSETLSSRGMIASIGTLYPVLGRLRERGLVVSFDESGNGPVRKYYRLTPAGNQRLLDFRSQWAVFTREVERFIEGDEHE